MSETITDEATSVFSQIDRQELIDIAHDLVRFPSIKGEETELARWLAGYFTERGYDVDLFEVEPGRFQTIATLRGEGGGKSLMLNGHIDIDPLEDGWVGDPFEVRVEDDLIFGAGIINMKGADASMIHAAEAIRKSGVKLKGDLVVALVAGELHGGLGTDMLMKSGFRTDAAIVPEAFGVRNVLTMNVGTCTVAVTVKGKSSHIMYKEDSVDAITKMLKAVPALNALEFTHEPRPDLPHIPQKNVGALIAGRGSSHDLRGPNYVADHATALIDVRFLPGQSIDSVQQDFVRVMEELKREDPELEYEVQIPPPAQFYSGKTRGHEPFEIPADEYIVRAVAQNYTAVTGKEPELIGVHVPGSYSGDDTSHLYAAGIPCVLWGPGHRAGIRSAFANECMDLEEMEIAAKVFVLTALDICNQSVG